jgi:hypothetical protein
MRFWCVISFCLFAFTSSFAARGDDLAVRVQEAYKKVKTKTEIEGITSWCKDTIVSMNFKEHDRVMVLALKAMQENKIDDANVFLKQARALDELSDNLGAVLCRRK